MSNMSTCQDSLRLKASRPRHSSSVRLRSRVASMASCGKRLSQNGSFFQGTKHGMTLKDGLNFCCKRVLSFCGGQMFVLESCFQVVGIWDWVNYSSWYNAHEFTSWCQRAAPAALTSLRQCLLVISALIPCFESFAPAAGYACVACGASKEQRTLYPRTVSFSMIFPMNLHKSICPSIFANSCPQNRISQVFQTISLSDLETLLRRSRRSLQGSPLRAGPATENRLGISKVANVLENDTMTYAIVCICMPWKSAKMFAKKTLWGGRLTWIRIIP